LQSIGETVGVVWQYLEEHDGITPTTLVGGIAIARLPSRQV
jgi:hypothetical protein